MTTARRMATVLWLAWFGLLLVAVGALAGYEIADRMAPRPPQSSHGAAQTTYLWTQEPDGRWVETLSP